jgi:hypothetical protein
VKDEYGEATDGGHADRAYDGGLKIEAAAQGYAPLDHRVIITCSTAMTRRGRRLMTRHGLTPTQTRCPVCRSMAIAELEDDEPWDPGLSLAGRIVAALAYPFTRQGEDDERGEQPGVRPGQAAPRGAEPWPPQLPPDRPVDL